MPDEPVIEVAVVALDGDVGARPEANLRPAARPRVLWTDFSGRVDELGDALNSIAVRLRTKLDALGQDSGGVWRLDEVQLAFSLDLKAETGVIVARASGGAGFEATLTWRRPSSGDQQ
jgi:hypothetical protein